MLKNKTALITGSTSGIGYGIAMSLAKEGCNIIFNGFADQETVEKIQNELSAFNNKVSYYGADITKPAEIVAMINAAGKEFGSIDILVNNAGIQRVHPVQAFPDKDWDDVIAANLTASFHTIKHTLPIMRAKAWGRIINIVSTHGLVASENKAAYVAAKHGLIGLTKVIALETAQENITCNAICPGWVLTPLVQKQIDEKAALKHIPRAQAERDLLAEKQPSLQFVQPSQIGEFVLFLCSDAASQIKGSALTMDGGWTAQ